MVRFIDESVVRGVMERITGGVCRVRVCYGCVEFDVVCVRGDGYVVVVEVKSRFDEFNKERVVKQVYARLCVADEVWLAVPFNDAWFAAAVLPNWCGVLGVREGGEVEVIRAASKVEDVCLSGLSYWRW